MTRRQFLRTSLLGSGSVVGASALGYAHWIEPNKLSITEKKINIPQLPPSLNGLKIAQMSDFHYRPNSENDLIAEAVKVVNAAQPDIIALTGDFVTHNASAFAPLMEHLSQLRAKHGIYGVMGNHDVLSAPYSVFQNGFKQAGFDFLINQGSHISIHGEPLYILGTDSIYAGDLDLPACYRGLRETAKESPVLALVHEPDVFDIIAAEYPVALQLSGHTHGGQCRIPVLDYAPIKVKYGKKYVYGEYKHEKQNARLFVSRGLGTTGLPVRFACPPEVAILTCCAC